MRWKNLQEFKVIAELENVTHASDMLHIAQPALTRSVRALEEELGAPLFLRKGKNIEINENGRIVLEYIDQIEDCMKQMKQDLRDQNFGARAVVRLLNQSAMENLDELIIAFHQSYPDIRLEVCSNDLPYPSHTFPCDFIINGPMRLTDPTLYSALLLTEDLRLAVSSNSALACRDSICLSEVASENWILTQYGSDLRQRIDSYLLQAGFSPASIFVSDDYVSIRSFIKSGYGVSLVPLHSWGYENEPGIRLLPIQDVSCRRSLLLSWQKEPLSPEAEAFRDFILAFYHELWM